MWKYIHPKKYKSFIRLTDGSLISNCSNVHKNFVVLNNDTSTHPLWNFKIEIVSDVGQVSKFQNKYNLKL